MIKMVRLPKSWYWSYIIPTMKKANGKVKNPCACAVRFLGERKDSKNTDIGELGLFRESFKTGKTTKEAKDNVIMAIKNKQYKERWISLRSMGCD